MQTKHFVTPGFQMDTRLKWGVEISAPLKQNIQLLHENWRAKICETSTSDDFQIQGHRVLFAEISSPVFIISTFAYSNESYIHTCHKS
jgi:hypothetical protein